MRDTDQTARNLPEPPTSVTPPGHTLRLFRPEVRFGQLIRDSHAPVVAVESWNATDDEIAGLGIDRLPLLVLPDGADASTASTEADVRVVVAAEGRDIEMAHAVATLLNPDVVTIELIHVTWLSGIASSPIDASGIDDPGHQDLLMYEGAREALLERSSELRAAGFHVSTRLRLNRHPAEAISAYLLERPAHVFVLGLGRHGAGIGRDILRENRLPLLFVRARG